MTAPPPSLSGENPTIATLRRGLMAILVFGLLGTIVELLLLGHTDGIWQLVPLALIVAVLGVLAWHAMARHATSLRVFRGAMAVFLLSGVTGTLLHFTGNVTYEKESNPSLSGRELYQKALQGSTPLLAPGVMIQMGLIGLLFTFRHPTLGPRRQNPNSL